MDLYVDANREVGDGDHLKVFANLDAADEWFRENDPEGVAFRHEIEGLPAAVEWKARDQEHIVRALREAGSLIGEYLELEQVRNSTATLNQLIAALDTPELAAALERVEGGYGLRVVK